MPSPGCRSAAQTISTQTCEFEWRAYIGPFGAVSACDALTNEEGRLDIMALGVIPIARTERSPALMRGELMRYLAELAWRLTAYCSISSYAGVWTAPVNSL